MEHIYAGVTYQIYTNLHFMVMAQNAICCFKFYVKIEFPFFYLLVKSCLHILDNIV